MTPAAMTPAAQRAKAKRASARSAPDAPERGHRRTAAPAPSRARRVSGPTGGKVAAGATKPSRTSASATRTATSRTAAPRTEPKRAPRRPATVPRRAARRPRITLSLPSFAPRRPRRTSGPAAAPKPPLSRRVLAGIAALPDHAVVDRLVRGRAWIPVLGVMLAGIVAMQVEVLKLGASTGRSIQLGNQLQAHNENLRVAVAALADDQRIEQLAAKQGMVMPAPSDIGFLSGGPGNLLKAVNAIHAPSLATFLNNTTVNGAVTTAQVTTPNPTAVAASSGGTGSSSSSVGSSGSTGSSGSAGSSGASATALAGGTTSGSGSGSSSGSGSGATATAAAPVGVAGQSHP